MKLLTNSRIKCYQRCPREHRFAYIDLWRPAKQSQDGALTFGSAFHDGTENYWNGKPIPAVLLDDPFENARVQALLAGYVARWSDDDAKEFESVAQEIEFQAPLVHPVTGQTHSFWTLSGKLDGILRERASGDVDLTERKTSGEDVSVGAPYWQRLGLDLQPLIYYIGAKALGFTIARTIYDVAVKPRQRPKKGESPEAFQARIMSEIAEEPGAHYSRGRLVRTQGEIDSAMIDVWEFADRMKRDMDEGWFPRSTSNCFKFNRPCAYLGCCSRNESPTEYDGFMKLETEHPELTNAAAA
jgi:hypothetical protein